MSTKQIDLWASEFGTEYAGREDNAITLENQRALVRDWARILDKAFDPAPSSAVEIGCNIGRNLVALKNFIPLVSGVEPNGAVCAMARANPSLEGAEIIEGHGAALPYDDGSFDLSCTAGVLIHVAPDDLGAVVDEIVRVSNRYIVCIEYFSREPVEIPYRGMDGYLFKRDFGRFYLDRHPSLRTLDYGFLWSRFDSSDDSNWWLFEKPPS